MIYTEEAPSTHLSHEIKENSIHVLNIRRENILNLEIGEIEGSGFEARIKNSGQLSQIMRKKIAEDKETFFVNKFLNAGKN